MRALPLLTLLLATPGLAAAQEAGETLSFNFRAGLGAQSAPLFFGSDETSVGVTGSFEFGDLSFGGRCFGCDDSPGWGPTGSFRYIGARDSIFDSEGPDIAVDPLYVYDAVDAAFELGGGLAYTSPGVEASAVVRRGFGGHEGYVLDLSADAVFAVSDALTLKVGPRLLAGDESYMDTYFSTTAGFLGTGSFEAGAGVASRGVEVSANYDVTVDWGIVATARYDQLVGDAANSPVSVSDDQTTLSLVVTRAFSLRF